MAALAVVTTWRERLRARVHAQLVRATEHFAGSEADDRAMARLAARLEEISSELTRCRCEQCGRAIRGDDKAVEVRRGHYRCGHCGAE